MILREIVTLSDIALFVLADPGPDDEEIIYRSFLSYGQRNRETVSGRFHELITQIERWNEGRVMMYCPETWLHCEQDEELVIATEIMLNRINFVG